MTAGDSGQPAMTALQAHRRGGPEQLVLELAPRPSAGRGELLVEVHAAAITCNELAWELSWARTAVDRAPEIPSHEFSGVVVARGSAQPVGAPHLGDAVFGFVPLSRNGAAAEYVAVPTATVALKPRVISHAEAAVLPLGAASAWQALVHHASIRPHEHVLVLGGLSAVGRFAVQIARACGAEVTATAPGDGIAAVRQRHHGVTWVHEGTFDRLTPARGHYDVVIDTMGGEPVRRVLALMQSGGRLVSLKATPDRVLAFERGVEATFFVVGVDARTLRGVADLVAAGELHTDVSDTCPLSAGRDAIIRATRSPRPNAKTVILVRDRGDALNRRDCRREPREV